MSNYKSTKVIELGSCAFRQWRANHSHCRFLHGYQLIAKIWFGCDKLDNKNWAVDFGGLKEVKAILQNQFDHTTIVAQDDPELETFKELDRKGIIQLRIMPAGVGIERAAEWVFITVDTYIKEATEGRCWVDQVEVFEHEDNSAIYSESLHVFGGNLLGGVQQVGIAVEPETIGEIKDNTVINVVPEVPNNAAPIGSQITEGKNGWFSGTRWG